MPITPFPPIDQRLLARSDHYHVRSTLSVVEPGVTGYQAFVLNRAYFVYVGRLAKSITPRYVGVFIDTGATGGTPAGEVGFFSSPSEPNYATQTLTKLAFETIDVATGGGFVQNATPMATRILAGTHLWAGIRTTGWLTAPDFLPLQFDHGEGRALFRSSSTAFSSVTTTTTTRYNASAQLSGPNLVVQV